MTLFFFSPPNVCADCQTSRSRVSEGAAFVLGDGESECGSATSRANQLKNHSDESLAPHLDSKTEHVHGRTHSLRPPVGSRYQALNCAHVRDRLTQSEECTDRKEIGPASPSHPCQNVFPPLLPLGLPPLFPSICLCWSPSNV